MIFHEIERHAAQRRKRIAREKRDHDGGFENNRIIIISRGAESSSQLSTKTRTRTVRKRHDTGRASRETEISPPTDVRAPI